MTIKKKFILSLMLASGLALGGCTSMSSTVDGKTHVFTEQQSCPTLLEMDRGQTLEVLLNENPSTGYVWSLAEQPKLFKVEEVFQSAQQQQAAAADATPVLGAGGQKTYRFTATTAGEELLHLKHARAWEKTAMAEWTCRVRVS
ncbi:MULTISPECIES: protease inhibitor I42 family protein [unclassified Acinetobacter]|uniref:protease inhibitor I42 family protein n=1 Tax=unclassified Acinetobacter TaxID=196816 RepID=UPI00211DAE0B|nr:MULTISPECIES: protease inhibitor I42 family protein [unclassified Acinetobacter]UUS61138.1 protease inhibitor I42 family protein [Acinetobacter sp. YH16056_T]